jgi:flavin-dependent thymidylate synthase
MNQNLTWKKFHPLSDENAFICLVDSMGDDSSIVQAARVSYGKDRRTAEQLALLKVLPGLEPEIEHFKVDFVDFGPDSNPSHRYDVNRKGKSFSTLSLLMANQYLRELKSQQDKDCSLIRYLMNHQHWTPFEMVEIKFMVQVPMDCWRQWIRHRTANVNEYSTRYTEALDMMQVTLPQEWRLQATDNKQGSSGYLEEWPEGWVVNKHDGYWRCIPPGSVVGYAYDSDEPPTPGELLSSLEYTNFERSSELYQLRLALGVAKEQARKDLPLSTYTRAYWKCDLRNIFNFLQLRMDSHAQYEIRMFANCMAEIVKQLCPVAYEAFEDYVLNAKKFSAMEMEVLQELRQNVLVQENAIHTSQGDIIIKPSSMTDREWKDFLGKLS